MKKKIVIELGKTKKGWTGTMYGVSNFKTDKIEIPEHPTVYGVLNSVTIGTKIEKIEQWMEQIQ